MTHEDLSTSEIADRVTTLHRAEQAAELRWHRTSGEIANRALDRFVELRRCLDAIDKLLNEAGF